MERIKLGVRKYRVVINFNALKKISPHLFISLISISSLHENLI